MGNELDSLWPPSLQIRPWVISLPLAAEFVRVPVSLFVNFTQ